MHSSSSSTVRRAGLIALATLGVTAAPAAATDRSGSETFEKGDNFKYFTSSPNPPKGGPGRDLVAASFDYDDAGKLQVTATMAGTIDREKASLQIDWALFPPNKKGRCGQVPVGDDETVGIQFKTNSNGTGVDVADGKVVVQGNRVTIETSAARLSGATLAGKDLGCVKLSVKDAPLNRGGDQYDTGAFADADLEVSPFVDAQRGKADKPVEVTPSGKVKLTVDAGDDTLTGTVTAATVGKFRLKAGAKRKVQKLGKAKVSIVRPASSDKVQFKLSKPMRALLEDKGRLRVRLTIRVKDPQGATVTVRQQIVLEAPIA